MKMKLKYISVALGTALLMMTSCNDFLDKTPDNRVELNTPEQLRLLLVSGYSTSNYALTCEFSTDNVIDNNSPNDQGTRYNLLTYDSQDDEIYAWQDVKSSTGSDSPSDVWSGCYHAIACANAVLEKIPEFEARGDSAKVAPIKGEALLIRAFNHFLLTNVFCMPYRGPELSKTIQGIPYITKPETTVSVKYERGNLEDNYESIEKDLLAGLPLINDGIYEVPKYHFNKAAANSFAARFYLFKREYDKVLKYANAAFGGEGVDASQFMSTIWSQSQLQYLSDFGRFYTNITQQCNFLVTATYSSFVRHFGGYRYTCNRDAKRATIQGPGPSWENCRYQNSQTKESFALNPCFLSMLFTAGGQEYGVYFGAPIAEQFEYTDKVAGIGYTHEVLPEFTGEQTLLARAEAKFFLGDIDGGVADLKIWDDARKKNSSTDDRAVPLTRDLIKNFYSRDDNSASPIGYGIIKTIHIDEVCPSTKYSLTSDILPFIQCVQHFRRIQNVHTGKRWFDIKRFGIEIEHKIGKSGSDKLTLLDPRWAIQIPTEVLSAGLAPNERKVSAPADETKQVKVQFVRVK